MTCTDPTFAANRFAPAAPLVQGGWLARAWRRINRVASVRAQRRALAVLDDRMLADVGLTRAQALRECERAVWDSPAHWRD